MARITESYNMKAFTEEGAYFGDIEECLITTTSISGWRIKASKNSTLSEMLGNAKGVVVPHRLVKAIGDIMIISKEAIPSYSDDE
ncbi:MAG: hypothetical protein ACOCRX_00280 [Candidatus Woesearchaeota archaeon]